MACQLITVDISKSLREKCIEHLKRDEKQEYRICLHQQSQIRLN